MSAAGRRIRPALVPIAAALAGLADAIVLFGQGGQDDVYISYWPARALVEHGALVNYNGLRLEQSSSLSLVLLLALAYALLPLSMPAVGYLVSLAGAGLAGLLAVRLARRMGLAARHGVLFAIATAPSFAYWATSGMETPKIRRAPSSRRISRTATRCTPSPASPEPKYYLIHAKDVR